MGDAGDKIGETELNKQPKMLFILILIYAILNTFMLRLHQSWYAIKTIFNVISDIDFKNKKLANKTDQNYYFLFQSASRNL